MVVIVMATPLVGLYYMYYLLKDKFHLFSFRDKFHLSL